MDPNNVLIKEILTLASAPQDPAALESNRTAFLDQTCRLLDSDVAAALLWIYDGPKQKLALQYISTRPKRERSQDGPPPLTYDVVCPEGSTDGLAALLESKEDDIQAQLAPSLGPAVRSAVSIRNTPLSLADGEPPLGVLQLLSSAPIPDPLEGWLPTLGKALAGMIARAREYRPRRALEQLWQFVAERRSAQEIFARACKVLRNALNAEVCVAYRLAPDLTLRACGSSPDLDTGLAHTAGADSLTAHLYNKATPTRLYDFHDDEERRRAFGRIEYDESLDARYHEALPSGMCKSFLASSVRVGEHPIALLKAVNKVGCVGRNFSAADEIVLVAVCTFLGFIISAIESNEAMTAISECASAVVLDDADACERLHEVLASHVPGLCGSAAVFRSTDESEIELYAFGGISWRQPGMLPSATDSPVLVDAALVSPAPLVARPLYEFTAEIPNTKGYAARFSLLIGRDYITGAERKLVAHLAMELQHVFRSAQLLRKELDEIVQIRHAIRSGLGGVIGHVSLASSHYEVFKQREFDRDVIRQARFRKALERTHLFAMRTHVLLEESRFLLSRVCRENLRVGRHAASRLLGEVVTCLQPEAERRRINVAFTNSLPPVLDHVMMDRQLLYILFFNVLDNAVKYSHRDQTVTIEVRAKRSQWITTVTNKGVFIPPEDRERIFVPFVRRATGQAATTRPGTGLGLPVARQIAEAHGGTIEPDSVLIRESPRLGETTFTVALPRSLTKRNEND